MGVQQGSEAVHAVRTIRDLPYGSTARKTNMERTIAWNGVSLALTHKRHTKDTEKTHIDHTSITRWLTNH